MSTPDHLAHLRRELDTFESYLSADLAVPIRHCGAWTLHDLAEHLGRSNRWAAAAITEGRGDYTAEKAPPEPTEVSGWFRTGSTLLLTALEADPASPAWTFFPPRTVGFWRRRRCLEALIHRWDAEHALGLDSRFDPELADDGVAEVFDTMAPFQISRGRAREPLGAVRFTATDTGSTRVYGPGEPVATATGTAQDLLLMLWNRHHPDSAAITWTGDRDAARKVLEGPLTP